MSAAVERWVGEREGAPSEAALRARLEQHGYRVSRYVYEPGTFFPEHTHDVDKIDAVVSGRFRIRMGDEAVVLEPGDWLEVPRGVVHSAEVIGADPVVSLDAIRG